MDDEDSEEHPLLSLQSDHVFNTACSYSNSEFGPSHHGYYLALYDWLRSTSFRHSSRLGSAEFFRPSDLPPDIAASIPGGPPHLPESSSGIAILRLSSILAFSAPALDSHGNRILKAKGNGGTEVYGDIAGLMLAAHHFNNGDGAVVREVEGLNETCPVRIVMDHHDSESSPGVAMNIFQRQVMEGERHPPSALIGASRSAVSTPLAIFSGLYQIPLVSPFSTSMELDNIRQYPYFSRLVPSDAGTARALVAYLRSRRADLRHLGVIYLNDAYGSAYFQAIQDAAGDGSGNDDKDADWDAILVKGASFLYTRDESSAEQIDLAIQKLADTGYRTFFGVFYDEHYDLVMERAVYHGIAGPGYTWILSDGLSETYLHKRKFEARSPLAIASQGVGIIMAEGGRPGIIKGGDARTGYDRLDDVWYRQGAEVVEYYNCVSHPKSNTMSNQSIYYQAPPDFFLSRSLHPTAGATFGYDSIMALGLAACGLFKNGTTDAVGTAFGEELIDAFVKQEFEGGSGTIKISPKTKTRTPETAFFVLYNAVGITSGGMTTFTVRDASHSSITGSGKEIQWANFDGVSYIYSDGTANFPPSLPPMEPIKMKHLTPAILSIGILMAAIVMLTALLFMYWTYANSRKRVVKASQPMFLQMVCLGTLFMAAAIVSSSVDDGVADQSTCNVMCMLSPWFFFCGFVISFSALFSKTWRINKVSFVCVFNSVDNSSL